MTDPFLDAQAETAVKSRVAALESATGVEVVAAIIARADSYPEIPWKAFALGASAVSLAAAVSAFLEPGWEAFEAAAPPEPGKSLRGSTRKSPLPFR